MEIYSRGKEEWRQRNVLQMPEQPSGSRGLSVKIDWVCSMSKQPSDFRGLERQKQIHFSSHALQVHLWSGVGVTVGTPNSSCSHSGTRAERAPYPERPRSWAEGREVKCSFHTDSHRFSLKTALIPSVTISLANASHCAMVNYKGLEVKFSHNQKKNKKPQWTILRTTSRIFVCWAPDGWANIIVCEVLRPGIRLRHGRASM